MGALSKFCLNIHWLLMTMGRGGICYNEDMTLIEKLNNDVKDALRAKDEMRKLVLRGLLASVKNAQVDQRDREMTDEDVVALIQKEIKSLRETVVDAERAERPEIVTETHARIEILNQYLPQQLTDSELETLVREVMARVGASDPKQQGLVMKELMPLVKGRADGKAVSATVARLLQP